MDLDLDAMERYEEDYLGGIAQKIKLRLTAYGMAQALGKALAKATGVSPSYVYALGQKTGGAVNGTGATMTLADHGWHHGGGGAQLIGEEIGADWPIIMSGILNERFREAGIDLFCEPATGFALSFMKA